MMTLISQLGEYSVTLQDCTVSPARIQDVETPAKQDDIIEINCTSHTQYDACIFTHTRPFDVGQGNGHECSITGGESQRPCADDPRISITATRNSCSLRINKPEPDDTGIWKVKLLQY